MAIPKLLHFVWIGGKPLTDDHHRWMKSWVKWHPDWRVRVWLDDHAEQLMNDIGGIWRMKWGSYTQVITKADMLKYVIVWKHGGVYSDLDFECFGPIDEWLVGADVLLTQAMEPRFVVSAGLLGSVPGHSLWSRLIGSMPLGQPDLVSSTTGPIALTRVAVPEMLARPGIRLVDVMKTNPYSWRARHEYADSDTSRFPGSTLIHRAEASWHDQEVG